MVTNPALAEVTAIMEDVFDLDDLTVTEATTAEDIEEWDSLSHIRLIVAIERRFGKRRLRRAAPHEASQLPARRHHQFFTKLALCGTPAFVIGDQIVYGEDMDAVDAAIARARGSASRT